MEVVVFFFLVVKSLKVMDSQTLLGTLGNGRLMLPLTLDSKFSGRGVTSLLCVFS